MVTGQIKEMLILEGTTTSEWGLVTIEVFELGEHLHPDFEMPILTCFLMEQYYTAKSQVSNLICSFGAGILTNHQRIYSLYFLWSMTAEWHAVYQQHFDGKCMNIRKQSKPSNQFITKMTNIS